MSLGRNQAKEICMVCAELCDDCVTECSNHNNELCKECAEVCRSMVHMDRKKFMHYNIIGCILWFGSMLLSGPLVYRFIFYEFNYDLTKHRVRS